MGRQKYIYAALGALFLIVVCYRFIDYRVNENFLIFSYLDCEPSLESCFYWDCTADEDPECDTSPYKKFLIPMHAAPTCVLENDCEEFECVADDGCLTILCSYEELDEGEACVSN